MQSQVISLRVGYDTLKITFHLRVISMAEESRYTQRFIDILDTGDSKGQKEYEIVTNALANWSDSMPMIQEGEEPETAMGEGTPADACKAYFKDMTIEKERIAHAAIITFRNKMTPSVSFL